MPDIAHLIPTGKHIRVRPLPTGLPFRVRTCGRIDHTPWHSSLGTYHEDAMLLLFVSGFGRYRAGALDVRIGPGTLGLILPEDEQGILAADPKDPYDHYYVRFAGDEALVMARRICHAMRAVFVPWSAKPLLPLLAEMRQCRLPRQDDEDRMLPIDALLAQLLVAVDRPTAETEPPEADHQGLVLYMERHLDRPMDLAVMAESFGLSKGHLCRLARQELGGTIVTVWRQMKIEWAGQLLKETDMHIDEISRRVGYESPFYFSTVFKRATGRSPSAFRSAP